MEKPTIHQLIDINDHIYEFNGRYLYKGIPHIIYYFKEDGKLIAYRHLKESDLNILVENKIFIENPFRVEIIWRLMDFYGNLDMEKIANYQKA